MYCSNFVSAIDIANDIGNVSKRVYLAVGDGTWILPKCYPKSRALDMLFSRSVAYHRNGLAKMNDILMEQANNRIDHEKAGIRSSKPPLMSSGIGTNDDIQLKILAGKVRIYGHLSRLQQDKAHFLDGKVISGIEAIVFCTGQLPDLSFLELRISEDNGKVELYKMMFPVKEKHHTLALIGHFGADSPLALPTRDQMKKDAEFWNAQVLARRGKYGSYLVNGTMLSELLALELGCYPKFWSIFFADPVLAFRVWYGPIQWEAATKLSHAFFEEGHSSLRHREVSRLQRPDIFRLATTSSVVLVIVSSVTAIIGFVACKYHIIQKITFL
ncbi:unnamed protein product [Candidula unifasciata]|uniref:Flavin-containing monooxygenase n=1 Tax=Candidula unifasciata TaxID=100452 RepID=A0A8S3ZQ82_9EUPU|nr:unnamed protein product [Candidula unifasciata]